MAVSSEETLAAPREAQSMFRRVLLKLSGESLMGDREYGMDRATIDAIAEEIVDVQSSGVEIAIVVGAGNIYRGMEAAAEGMDRATGDYAGMLATVLNSLALQDALEDRGGDTRILSALELRKSPSRTSGGGRSGISKRAASSSSRPARAIRSSPPTPQPRCGRSRSTPTRS